MAKKGGGGSQLSQLKSRLRDDGIADRRQMKLSAKKRKRGQAGPEKDEMAERREKLNRIASSSTFNPFEERITKPKNAVLGRKIKGAVGRPGAAKMGGLQERKERLLPEWKDRNKSGSFVDRRFGENGSDNLSLEEKMLERFTRERQSRVGKMSLYNLDDGEEEGLTHYGKNLNDLDDYDDIHLSDEEEGLQEEGAHFGGFEEDQPIRGEQGGEGEDEERRKSKAEVMKEVMLKSKLAKYERQQTRMADDDIREELDNELGDIRSLLFEVPTPAQGEREQTEKRPLYGNGTRKDAYDSAVRELAFERRAKPQDRLKTEAEKAEELAEKLKKAEESRLKRMRGEEVSDDEERRKKGRVQGGDDLEDDFELDGMTSRDVYGLGQGLAAEHNDDSEEDEEEGGETSEEEEEEDSGNEEDEKDFDDLADMDGLEEPGENNVVQDSNDEEEQSSLTTARSKRKASESSQSAKMLPFTFPCPSTHDELLDILEANQVSISHVPLVLKRIRALYHPSLAEVNKFKLQAFLGVLLDHLVYTAAQITTQQDTSSLRLIDFITGQIFSMSKIYPATSAEHFVGKLALMQRNLVRGLNKGPLLPDSKTWPGPRECILLRVTSTIWPTSDRVHAVSTPLMVVVGQYLSSCRVRSVSDLISGLFLCSLTYNNERQSKRLVPEALNFLHCAVTLLAPVKSVKALRQIDQAFGIPSPDAAIKSLQIANSEVQPSDKVDLVSGLLGHEEDIEETKASTLLACFSLLADFATLYAGSSAFVELFEPFHAVVCNLGKLHPKLGERRSSLEALLARMIGNAKSERRFLRLQAHRAIAIASHVPKFDQGFNPERRGGRTFDPDTERAEQSKLQAMLKKERKGAMRELRRDNEFLANEKRKEREEEDQRYKKTIDKIVGSLSSERSEQKKYLKEKDRLKKRSGKK